MFSSLQIANYLPSGVPDQRNPSNSPIDAEKLGFKIGDIVRDIQGRNILITGPNGSGKSTFLRMMYRSLLRNLIVQNVGYDGGDNYEAISLDCEEFFHRTFDDNGSIPKKELPNFVYNQLLQGIEDYFGDLTIRNFLDPMKTATKGQLIATVRRRNGTKRYTDYDRLDDENLILAANKYAKEKNVRPEIVYGNLVLLISGHIFNFQHSILDWLYVVPELAPRQSTSKIAGLQVVSYIGERSRITNPNDGEDNGKFSDALNSGERAMGAIRRMVSDRVRVGILDEPTAKLDDENAENATKILVGGQGVKEGSFLVIATNDRALKSDIRSRSDKWCVVELPFTK